jgi:hypothetical protein
MENCKRFLASSMGHLADAVSPIFTSPLNYGLFCYVTVPAPFEFTNRNDYVGYEVLAAAITKAAIFWDIAPCSQYMNKRFGRTYHLHLQGRKSAEEGTSELEDGHVTAILHSIWHPGAT